MRLIFFSDMLSSPHSVFDAITHSFILQETLNPQLYGLFQETCTLNCDAEDILKQNLVVQNR